MRVQTKKQLYEFYHGCCVAYNRIFDKQSPFTETVLADLAKFCRASESTFHVDARAHALMEGRREVYLRIQEFINLNADQLLEKYAKEVKNEQTKEK
jgi:hypothetical protein